MVGIDKHEGVALVGVGLQRHKDPAFFCRDVNDLADAGKVPIRDDRADEFGALSAMEDLHGVEAWEPRTFPEAGDKLREGVSCTDCQEWLEVHIILVGVAQVLGLGWVLAESNSSASFS